MCQAHYGSALYVLVNNRSYFRNEAIKQIQNEHNHHHPPLPPPPHKPAHGNVICMPLNN